MKCYMNVKSFQGQNVYIWDSILKIEGKKQLKEKRNRQSFTEGFLRGALG